MIRENKQISAILVIKWNIKITTLQGLCGHIWALKIIIKSLLIKLHLELPVLTADHLKKMLRVYDIQQLESPTIGGGFLNVLSSYRPFITSSNLRAYS